jgi:hypothetical protein
MDWQDLARHQSGLIEAACHWEWLDALGIGMSWRRGSVRRSGVTRAVPNWHDPSLDLVRDGLSTRLD